MHRLIMSKYILKFFILTFVITIFTFSLSLANSSKASALTGSDFNPGRIIDLSVFTNSNSMSAADIQNFLNSNIPNCDTSGSQLSSHSNGIGGYYTRAQWGAVYDLQNHTNIAAAPYVCINNYVENTSTGQNNLQNPGANIVGAISAAQIIYNAARQYQINPQVILTTLQKEQGLITDSWPWTNEYTEAMGFNCPDTAACSGFLSLYQQVNAAARQFRDYLNNPDSFNYVVGNNTISFAPASYGCSSSSIVNIQNQATAALYNYTPYQPDPNVLANTNTTGSPSGPGGSISSRDNCATYGNRNFWWYFNTWFGPTTSIDNILSVSNVSKPAPNPATGQSISYSFTLNNTSGSAITISAVGIVGRLNDQNNGANRDMGWQGPVTIQAGSSQNFTFTNTVTDVGNLYVCPSIVYSGQYTHFLNNQTILKTHQANLSIVAGPAMSPSNPVAGQTVTLSATIKNNESQPIKIDSLGIPIKYYGVYGYDVGWTSPSQYLNPGQTLTTSGSTIFDKSGPYTYWVSWNLGSIYTTLSTPTTINVTAEVPNFKLSYTNTPDLFPSLGEKITISYTLKNNSSIPMTLNAVGIVGRYDNPYSGGNHDLGWIGPTTFAAGASKSFTFNTTIESLSNYFAWVAIQYNGSYIHYNNWGFMMSPHNPNISIVSNLSPNAATVISAGQSSLVTVTIKNNESHSITFDAAGIPIRYYGVYNYDATWLSRATLAASGQPGNTLDLSGNVYFNKPGPYTIWTSLLFGKNYFTVETPTTINVTK